MAQEAQAPDAAVIHPGSHATTSGAIEQSAHGQGLRICLFLTHLLLTQDQPYVAYVHKLYMSPNIIYVYILYKMMVMRRHFCLSWLPSYPMVGKRLLGFSEYSIT